MSTSPGRARLTRPMVSRLVLEGAAGFVSLVLVVWLLFWFMTRGQKEGTVVARYVADVAYEVPYLDADAGAVAAAPAAGAAPASGVLAAELVSGLAAVVGVKGRSAAVVSIAEPTLRRDRVVEVVTGIARAARRDVLILLDAAQIDSERETSPGVFGNAPYLGLGDALARVKGVGPNVVVLCSCSPGQMSWPADGLGRSAFSYFAAKGLLGEARDPADPRAAVRPVDLERYVAANVSEWVANHRDRAVQTPRLLRVGDSVDTFRLPRFRPLPEAPAEEPVPPAEAAPPKPKPGEKGQAKEPAVEKPPPPKDPRAEGLADLMKEWGAHETLLANPRTTPYRHVPAGWRVYESLLLKAERRLRAAWNDPVGLADGLAAARQDLADARSAREDRVAGRLAAVAKADAEFPFLPVATTADGAPALNRALNDVTGQGIDALGKVPAEGPAAKASADPAAKPAAGPDRFLELRPVEWARTFAREFQVDRYFRTNERGGLLRRAVADRLNAETALATDRRGLDWVRADVERGDLARRRVQDGLFDTRVDVASTADRIGEFGKVYETALGRIKAYAEARGLLERIGAELPFLGEWAVRHGAIGEAPAGPPLPADVSAVVRATERLVRALESRSTDGGPAAVDPVELAGAFKQATADFDALARAFANEVRGLKSSLSWRRFDDALRVPMLTPADRAVLLDRVTRLDTEPPPPTAAVNAPKAGVADPGLLRKALGLAALERELQGLASGGRPVKGLRESLTALDAAIKDVSFDGLGTDPKALDESLNALSDVSAKVREVRSHVPHPSSNGRADSTGPATDHGTLAAGLRGDDRSARFRSSWELANHDFDEFVRDLDDFSRRETLVFQAERLARDYDEDASTTFDLAFREFPRAGPVDRKVSGGRLTLNASPAQATVDPKKRRTKFQARVEETQDVGNPNVVRLPGGRAFLGAVLDAPEAPAAGGGPDAAAKPHAPLLNVFVCDPDENPLTAPGTLAGALTPVNEGTPEPVLFLVKQLDSAEPDMTRRTLHLKAFYRGRVENASRADVALALRKFADPVSLTIRQDRKILEKDFGVLAAGIRDQFDAQQTRGCFHEKGRFGYVLEVKNESPEPLRIRTERKLVPSEGVEPAKEIVLPPQEDSIEPDKSIFVRGVIDANQVPVNAKKKLVVTVSDAAKKISMSREYHFEQLPVQSYLSFVPEIGPGTYKGVKHARCFLLTIVRKPDDPATEPVMLNPMEFTVNGASEPMNLPDTFHLPLREQGESSEKFAYWNSQENDKAYVWEVTVEKTKVSGTYKPPDAALRGR